MSKLRMVSILVLVCAARMARANDWTELGVDSEDSRATSEQSGPVFAPSWSYSLNSGPIVATPVTSGGEIVVAGSNGAVSALNATDGSVVWSQSVSTGVRATPMVSGKQVAVSTMGGQLYAFDVASGNVLWQRTFGGQNFSSPVFVKSSSVGEPDTFVVGSGFPSQDVWRFNALTGEPLWQTPKGAMLDIIESSAVVAGNHLMIGVNGGTYQTLDLATGAPGWNFAASGPLGLSSPLVVGDRVYMFPGARDAVGSYLFAADANTGAAVPGFPVTIPDPAPVPNTMPFGRGPGISSPMTIGGLIIAQQLLEDYQLSGSVVQVSMREWVVAIDPVAARVVWQYNLANATAATTNDVPELGMCATPAGFTGPSGAYVAVSSAIAGRMVVLDAQTGAEQWTTTLSSAGRSSPVFSNGQLLIATDDSVLHAFSSMTNQAPTPPTSIAPSSDQTVATAGTQLDWQGASDPEGASLSYVVRMEEDGHPETLTEISTSADQTQATVALTPSTTYLFAVRSRDAQGALSAWSIPQLIQVAADGSATSISSDPAPVVATAPAPSTTTTDSTTTDSTTTATAPAPDTTTTTATTTTTTTTATTTASDTTTTTTSGKKSTTKTSSTTTTVSDTSTSTKGSPKGKSSMLSVSLTRQADLGPQVGCSFAPKGGASAPASLLGLAMVALVLRRRGRAARGGQAA